MTLLALGLNHHSCPLDLRGRFAIPLEQLGARLQQLRAHLQAVQAPTQGLTILSTCNRTELFATTPQPEPLLDWLASLGGSAPGSLRAHSYVLQGEEAVARHAFRVAAGLDSAVLGEPQILGQLKTAVRTAEGVGLLDPTLQQLFQRSFAVAKAVRSRTELGTHAVSLAGAALRLAQQLFGDLHERKLLFIGAGDMIELMATHFAAAQPARMAVANRSAERGEQLARQLGAEALPLRGLDERLAEFDVVVSCTASSLPLIGLGAVQRALKARRRRPMLMVDLAVPRDIEAEVGRLDDVFLYTVDDLAARAREGGQRRQAAVAHAEVLVDQGLQGFRHWLQQRQSLPTVHALQQRGAEWQALELARARRALARGAAPDEVMAQLAAALTAKALHGALAGLHASSEAERPHWDAAARRCFL